MDVEALLEEDEDDVLEDIDMSQPVDSSQDLVDFEDMTPVPSPAKSRETGGVPTPGAPPGAPSQANAPPPFARVGEPGGAPGVGTPDACLAMDAEAAEGEEAQKTRRRATAPFVSEPRRPSTDLVRDGRIAFVSSSSDAEMRDQHTFVPLEPSEVRLAERICRRVDEPKKHLVRLLVGAFGAALAEGALHETERAFEADRERRRRRKKDSLLAAEFDDALETTDTTPNAEEVPPLRDVVGASSAKNKTDDVVYFDPGDGGPPRRRTPGGAFIRVFRARAPEKEFKAVLRRSAEIDKLLRKQMEARDDDRDRDRGGAFRGASSLERFSRASESERATKKRSSVDDDRIMDDRSGETKKTSNNVFGGGKKRARRGAGERVRGDETRGGRGGDRGGGGGARRGDSAAAAGIEAAAENVFRRRERNFFGRGEEQAAAGRLKNNAAAAAAALFYADDV